MPLTDEDKQWISEHLERVETEFSQRLERVETRLLMQFHDERQWTSEQLERVETNLLTAFRKWASPFEARQRGHSAALRAFDVLLEDLTDRVKKLEEGKQ
jgi:hypothetical protein